MDKPAPADFPIADLISKRWSPRAFSDRSVDSKTVHSLLEAARWAPSSSNEQPWNFIIASKDNPEEFAKMLTTLVDANQAWAKDAPLLMISVASSNWKRNGKPNRHAEHDTGLASANLALQATSMGMQVHMMAGFDVDKARKAYNIPDGFMPMAAFAIGYPTDPSSLPEELRTREIAPRSRKPLGDFVFSGNWGDALK